MDDAAPTPNEAMLSAMAELWRLSPPGPDNLLESDSKVMP